MLKIISLLLTAGVLAGCSFATPPAKESADQADATVGMPAPGFENIPEMMVNDQDISANDVLDLSGQGLTQVSQDVFKQTNLKKLDISNNNLVGALPAEIRHLQNLVELNASNNKMTGIPAEIGQLKKLQILNLSNNQLTGLPYELGNLSNLQVLNLSGNNYSEQDLSVILQTLPASITIIK